MRKRPRNSDGSIRNTNRPQQLTQRSIIARWVEGESLHLKRLGMSYQAIADHIVDVAKGRQKPIVPIPADAVFREDYRISAQAVHLAFNRALRRVPNAEAAVLRRLDSERCEDLYLALQAGIRKGEAKAVDAAVRVLSYKARINGYEAPKSIELGGKNGGTIPISLIQDAVDALDDQEK